MYLGDALHGLASELGQVPIEGELVVQDLIGLDFNIYTAHQWPTEQQHSLDLGDTLHCTGDCIYFAAEDCYRVSRVEGNVPAAWPWAPPRG